MHQKTTRRRRIAGCGGKTVLDYGTVNYEAWGREWEGKNLSIGEGWEMGIRLEYFLAFEECCFKGRE
jgi:hypothetical protein